MAAIMIWFALDRLELHELSGWCRFVKGIFLSFIEEKNILFVHTTVLSFKTAFNLVKIHLLFRTMILIQ